MKQHDTYMDDLLNKFDAAYIPPELHKILANGQIEYLYFGNKRNGNCKMAEVSVLTTDLRRRIFVLYDYGYCLKFDEIKINKFTNNDERNKEVIRLYREFGLSQQFLAHVFKVSQPTISMIIKRQRGKNGSYK